jgi:hypothetical protein
MQQEQGEVLPLCEQGRAGPVVGDRCYGTAKIKIERQVDDPTSGGETGEGDDEVERKIDDSSSGGETGKGGDEIEREIIRSSSGGGTGEVDDEVD